MRLQDLQDATAQPADKGSKGYYPTLHRYSQGVDNTVIVLVLSSWPSLGGDTVPIFYTVGRHKSVLYKYSVCPKSIPNMSQCPLCDGGIEQPHQKHVYPAIQISGNKKEKVATPILWLDHSAGILLRQIGEALAPHIEPEASILGAVLTVTPGGESDMVKFHGFYDTLDTDRKSLIEVAYMELKTDPRKLLSSVYGGWATMNPAFIDEAMHALMEAANSIAPPEEESEIVTDDGNELPF
jgi:hypothetical protein